jgi:hypothetical protein
MAKITLLANIVVSHNNTLTFYTDRSLANNKDNLADLIMSAAWYNTETNTTIGYRIWSSISSTNSEAKTILLALKCTPMNTIIYIYTNSLATFNILKLIISHYYRNLTTRNIIKRNYWIT